MPESHESHVIVYRIDAANRLIHVNEAWSQFAQDNHGSGLLPEHVLGRNLLEAISDMTVRELYLRMIQLARSGKPLRFHYRCDAPDMVRTFEMEVRPLHDGAVEFRSTLEHEAPRPSVAVLEHGRPRDERLLTVCSWCQKVEMPGSDWVPVEAAVIKLRLLEADTLPRLSHGICPPCAKGWFASDGNLG